jgi:hypothetical protein
MYWGVYVSLVIYIAVTVAVTLIAKRRFKTHE